MKSNIKESNAKTHLKDLSSAADTYAVVTTPLEAKWAKEERELRESLAALSVFHVAQALPLALSIMRRYRAKVISLSSAKKTIGLIEKFTFLFNAVTQSRGGGGIANMYAKLGQAVHACDDSQQFAHVFKDITKKLEDRVPQLDEFKVGFNRIHFRSDFARDRMLVRYILRKFSEHYGLPVEIDGNLYTIEHVKPESSWNTIEEMFAVGELGNLLFVSEATNQKLLIKPFNEKLKILTADKVPMDPMLIGAKKWEFDDIPNRTSSLAKIAYEEIWKI